jgi:hypothetical protein
MSNRAATSQSNSGVWAPARWLLLFFGLVYRRQLITVKHLIGTFPEPPDLPDVDVAIVDSARELRRFAHEIRWPFRDSFAVLETRLDAGCVVCLARSKRADGQGMEVIGYELAERGIFSALGRRTRVSPDVIFSHWAEVIPERRGQRIHGGIFAARDEYFRRRGGAMVVGVCRPDNHASLRALRRDGADVVGAVERIALGLWRTPDSEIVQSLADAHHRRLEFLKSRGDNPEAVLISGPHPKSGASGSLGANARGHQAIGTSSAAK